MSARELGPSELTVAIDPAQLGFQDTAQLAGEPCGWIGQPQAEIAARFGLGLDHPDYHLFVLGEPGSGRSSLTFQLMQEMAAARPAPPDLVCLYNFDEPQRPRLLWLKPGQGRVLRAALEAFCNSLQQDEMFSSAALADAINHLGEALAGRSLDDAGWVAYVAGLAEDATRMLAESVADRNARSTALASHLPRYRANLLVQNDPAAGAPAVRDDDPTLRSLFGGVDFQVEDGVLVTDYMRIRPGLLHRAHGGYLLLRLRDARRDPAVWEKLHRYLRNGRVQIEDAAAGTWRAEMPQPEAMALNVKLVLIGARDDYYDLQEDDPELMRHFRAKVDFAAYFPADTATRRALAAFIGRRCAALGLPHLAADAVARLLLEMQREIDDQRHLCSSFDLLESWLVEAAAHGRRHHGMARVSLADVEAALAARRVRHDYSERQLLEGIASGELLIQAHGSVVGQINGLAQVDQGDYRFGLPVRITARAFAGDDGVLNIDREVDMTQPSHDKGVLILQGWLSAAFAALTPLSLSASLVFEQEYYGVEGDSASCAELFALLSAISGVALPQGLGVTGALNQHGEVMPVGGINEKIEGWFRTCRALGLNGMQGVIIPARNRTHLLLDQEVRDAVARGEFRIHVIDHVLDGIALLTGMPAGEPDAIGRYPEDTLLGRVQHALEEYRRACDESGHQREHEHHGK